MPLGCLTPTAQAAHAEAESVRTEQDKNAIVALISSFDKRGELVTVSATGSTTVFKLLKDDLLFPPKTDSSRLMNLLRSLETEGRILRCEARNTDRRWKTVFKSAVIPSTNPEMELESLPLIE